MIDAADFGINKTIIIILRQETNAIIDFNNIL